MKREARTSSGKHHRTTAPPIRAYIQTGQLAQCQEIVFAPRDARHVDRGHDRRDGVNDAPSLQAADMVLLDSFSSVVEALRYGRMMCTVRQPREDRRLPASGRQLLRVLARHDRRHVRHPPQILSSFLMITICLFTDADAAAAAAAIAMVYEAPEADVLLRKPRVPGKDRLVDWQLVVQSYGLVRRALDAFVLRHVVLGTFV
ncbi:Sodium/potassium-transporting ATPase subunit alpha-3 [Colletotrichum tanaceti]|uniref:Sodium/potassium-transporting ATPase subunit alpha-3 n=1 Tax=Colletotrichum tanaceti TaxID=1306861 RepID=A0A4U6XMK1_9PEZI|nr:Sodium/potassium-transporting ATPase subunit alpha-3 [Colletotrichum tanaceti]TKW56917.1 Sodium/potassium-transporting ATPase subunit alpha-3 [Colletotrichum tanaceti]